MDRITSLGMLQASILGNNVFIKSNEHNPAEHTLPVEVKNNLTIAITNSSRTDSLTLSYEDSKPLPSIMDRNIYQDQPRIYVYFPVGNSDYHMTTKELIERTLCSVSRGWKVIPCDQDKDFLYGRYWAIIPDMELTGNPVTLYPGDSIIIQFASIITYRSAKGMSCACIDVLINQQLKVEGYLPIYIDRSAPIVRKFCCSQNSVGILDKVSFEWEVLGNVKQTYFYPGYGEVGRMDIPANSTEECVVMENTNYTIRVAGDEDITYGYCPVVVEEPEIVEFITVDGRTQYQYGDPIIFSIKLRNTNHCYINQGVGRVDFVPRWVEGYLTIGGAQEVHCKDKQVNYRVACLGKHGLVTETVQITVVDFLSVENIVYQRQADAVEKTFHYQLHWLVENATELEIISSDAIERTGSSPGHPILSGDTKFDYPSPQALSLTIRAKGSKGQTLELKKECIDRE